MKHRLIINIFLCFVFGTTLAFVQKKHDDIIINHPHQYELASLQSDQTENIVKHIGYTVSYNSEWRLPNWVAYELTSEEVEGIYPRENNFRDDPDIYGEAESSTYTNSGYDRGHMAPAGDMKWSKISMKESFYMTNICPQNHNLNGGDWKELEEHVRLMATKYEHVYICCGPIVSAKHKTIGNYSFEKIVVPDAFFKVLLRQKDSTWTSIGFKMPNKAGHNALSSYAMSVNDLEKLTEIDFFYNLPDSIEDIVEKSYKLSDWDLKKPTIPKPKKSTTSNTTTRVVEPIETTITKEEPIVADDIVVIPVETESTSTSAKSSSTQSTYNGHTLYTGPRGGRYYYNSKGKKVYVKH
ncbi:MAG: DNA/RNA non-specific endonuclease [Paludibacteraceae bacterium]|nr:DNA/RNA non-specific endonuclease [Paludibacteraceae bacterium]